MSAQLIVSLHKLEQPKRPSASEWTANRHVPAQQTSGAHNSVGSLKCLLLREGPALWGPTYVRFWNARGHEQFQVRG